MILEPKQHKLTAILETDELGLKVMAFLHMRSSLAREGVIGNFAVVDPGFRGQLTLNLCNPGEKEIMIREGEPMVQIVFHKLGGSARKSYSGSCQNSRGIVPNKRQKLRLKP